ncbi:lipopolysaccharide heptosyltransferase II [Aquabacter spiritensis]|uniref:lipopolysaccharide heptosyltransferase II n=1 Tax=Aquabacter spiritensis TaxID=933073 RepID=A0A4R3LPV6_9HYPH|nr:lipopolysaccharide heptosyltransferase II [Aquabacter spiritensis]TCT01579.1 heptosyltransferase-2 [Aquabacter spiritensis]
MRAFGSVSPILVVGPSWVGDMVMAGSLIESLRVREPGRPIDVIAPPSALPIARLIRGVRRTIPLGLGHGEFGLVARWRAGRALREEGYGKAIILPRAFKAAIVPFAAGIPERIGYAAEGRSLLLTEAREDRDRKTARTIDRFVALGAPRGDQMKAPRPVLHLPDGAAEAAASRFPLAGSGAIMALCPGAEYGPAKRWPAAKFARLANLAQAAGYRIRVLGGPKDAPIAEEIVRLAGTPVDNLVGRTSLLDAAAILAAADVVVSNDSGLMHVAGALDRPLVVLYGSSSEKLTPPTGPRSSVVSHDLPCRPCFKRECPLKTLACFEAIQPAEVLAAAVRVRG